MKRKKKTTGKKAAKKSVKKSVKKSARKAAARRPVARRASRRVKRTAPKKIARRKPAPKKPVAKKRAAARRAPAGGSTERPRALPDQGWRRGMGAEAGGQSGDTEALSRSEIADSESVEELLEEGQSFEAGIVDAVENAPDADEGPIRTREVPEDDVPEEYLDKD